MCLVVRRTQEWHRLFLFGRPSAWEEAQHSDKSTSLCQQHVDRSIFPIIICIELFKNMLHLKRSLSHYSRHWKSSIVTHNRNCEDFVFSEFTSFFISIPSFLLCIVLIPYFIHVLYSLVFQDSWLPMLILRPFSCFFVIYMLSVSQVSLSYFCLGFVSFFLFTFFPVPYFTSSPISVFHSFLLSMYLQSHSSPVSLVPLFLCCLVSSTSGI